MDMDESRSMLKNSISPDLLQCARNDSQYGRHWGWIQILVLIGIFSALYWNVTVELFGNWWNDPNYSHGFFVPLFSGYLVWKERAELRELPLEGSLLGLPVLLLGLGSLVLGEVGAEHFTSRTSLIITLTGLVLLHFGIQVFKKTIFPLLFLFFMIPLPAVLFNAVAFPLQRIATHNAAWTLDLLGIPILLDGNVIHLSNASLGVTEACSGIRSLISLLALAAAWAYLTFRSNVSRLMLVASTLPITILANAMRVVITGVIAYWFGTQYIEGFYHSLTGWLVFITAFAGLLGTHGLINLIQTIRSKSKQ